MSANTRIRYQRTGEATLKSRRMFLTKDGEEVSVELDLEAKKYRVINSVTGIELVSGGHTRNKSVLKIQAKQALTELGVEFGPEIRRRSVGVGEAS